MAEVRRSRRKNKENSIALDTGVFAAGTAATTEASVDTEPDNGDNFDGINWDRLPRFMKPLTTGRRVKSWIFQHGYRVVELYDQNRVWFVCKYCHIHKVIDTGGKTRPWLYKDGLKPRRTGQQLSLRQTLETGVAVSQEAANAMGNFNIQQFREVAVFCLLDNNLPMELLARPSFREMISLANPEAEAALWVSPRSVATYAMRLFQYMQPQIVCALSEAASKIHISFDGWTTKGGKRGFFGVVAHFANASGVIQDLPIALPHLAGSHTGDAIADTIKKTLQEYSIGSDKLGYFVLDNAANNDTAVSSLAHAYDFNAAHRRLRCGPHTLNLIGQAIIFGSNQEAYNNNNDEQLQTEEVYMQEWRQEGPLGVLIDVINHIKTPQQHEIFRSFQTAANAELPARERLHVLEPVKPVVTRWNSYYAAFKRATQLQAAYNSYAEHYINALSLKIAALVNDCLEPLKLATEKLEGRGKAGKYGAIYETIPVFEYVLGALEARTRSYEQVDFNPPDAPEDHLFVNLRAAWSKANDYYNKLDRSPAYYAATCLHPYYKYYCENSWVDKPEWLTSANAGFLQLWQSYKPQRTRPLSQTTAKPRHRGIDDVIGALVRRNKAQVEAAHDDEYERWRTQEPEWTSEQYLSDGHPVKYWIQLRSKYPCLSQFAIDILTIPASSCDCERLFSELGDLLEPRRRALGSELLAALQLVRSWRRAGFDGLYNNGDDEDKWSDVKDEEIVQQYDIEGWKQAPEKYPNTALSATTEIDFTKNIRLFEDQNMQNLWHKGRQEDTLYQELTTLVANKERNLPTILQKEKAGRKHGRDPKTSDEEDGQPRRKREVIGSSSVSATQPSCLRDCVCGQAHKYADCWYLNPAKAPAKWRPQVHVQSEVITAISGSNRQREKIEKRYSRSKIALPDFWNSNNADDQSEKATSQASSATLTVGHVFECDFCDLAFYDSRDLEDHQQDEGHYGPRYECEACDEWYDTFARIKQHMNSHGHWRNHYCNDCNKGFENENNLQIVSLDPQPHAVSDPTHRRNAPSRNRLVLKARQLNRDTILAEVRRRDPNQLITKKLLTYPESGSSITATSASYNCDTLLYECYLCHKGFRELKSLNAHVNSPVHKEKVYHCPGRACAREFRALAALFNHLESESCGAVRG
ncbi:Dimer-Tnp-hAT domain containing protein [Pyrenophora tritici-repentis]|nr:Dimer-Tnp-hAT domain containing protein [Pyrenophora tritici-repentis]